MKRKIVNKLLAGCLIAVLVTPSEALAVMDGSEEQNVAVAEELTDDEEEKEASSEENNQEPEQNPQNQETSEKETRTVQQESQSVWIKSGDRWWYRHADGSYTTSDWELIDGKLYYFDADGWMVTG